jgi:tRNA nucleotidyltransferase (CCA-adding enzyme)
MVDTKQHLTPEDNLVLNQLREHGEAWIVGGWVRDILLMSNSKSDLDIATTLLPKEVIEIFPKTIPVGEEFGTVLVRLEGDSDKEWEVTTLRKDGSYGDGRRPDNVSFGTNIMDDLARRDFTINAMAIDLDDNLIDIFGGENDLRLNIVKAVGEAEKRIAEDGLRILRAFRFLDLEKNSLRALDIELEKAIKENIDMLDKVSRERITDEIRKILASNNPYGILMKMQELGVLSNIMDDLNIEIKDLGLVQPMVILARLLKNNNFDGEHLSEILKRILKLSKKEIREISFLHENRNLKFDNSISSIRRFQVLLTEEQKLAILQYHNEEDFNEKYHNRSDDINIRPILDGTKISEITGIKPSRKLGLLKDWLFRIQIEENINQENKMIEILHDIDWNDSDFESWPKLSWP